MSFVKYIICKGTNDDQRKKKKIGPEGGKRKEMKEER